MTIFLQVLATFLAAVAMTFALAHAAELPGKMRLGKEAYLTVQPIYYPGFTVGAIAEPAAIVATLALFVASGSGLVLAAFLVFLAMHAVYWVVTHPVNGFWLKDQRLEGLGKGFFSFGLGKNRPANATHPDDWTRFRDRWEYSHVARAGLSMLGLLLLLIAVAS